MPDGTRQLSNEIELLEWDCLPGNLRVIDQTWFLLLSACVNRAIYLLQGSCFSIVHDLRPQVVRFAQGDGVCVARLSVATQRLIRNLCYMRTTENNFRAGSSDCIGHLVSTARHARHRTDTHKSNVV